MLQDSFHSSDYIQTWGCDYVSVWPEVQRHDESTNNMQRQSARTSDMKSANDMKSKPLLLFTRSLKRSRTVCIVLSCIFSFCIFCTGMLSCFLISESEQPLLPRYTESHRRLNDLNTSVFTFACVVAGWSLGQSAIEYETTPRRCLNLSSHHIQQAFKQHYHIPVFFSYSFHLDFAGCLIETPSFLTMHTFTL